MASLISNRAGFLACLATALFSFYDLLILSIFNVIGPFLLHDFNLSPLIFGFISASYLVACAIGLSFIGVLIDRYSVRHIVLIMLTLCTLATGMLATTHLVILATVARFAQGLASATSLLSTTRLGVRWFPKKAALASSTMIAFALLGPAAGNYLYHYLVEYLGWRHSLLVLAGLGAIILVMNFFFLDDVDHIGEQQQQLGFSFEQLLLHIKAVLKPWQNIAIGFYFGIMSLPVYIWGTLWGNLYLQQHFHIAENTAVLANTLLFFGMIIGAPILGYISDTLRLHKQIIYLSLVGLLLGMAIIIFSTKLSVSILISLFFLLGFLLGGQNIAYALLSRLNPAHVLSAAIGIAALINNLIGATAQILFAFVIK